MTEAELAALTMQQSAETAVIDASKIDLEKALKEVEAHEAKEREEQRARWV